MASGTTRYKYETDANNVFYARTDNANTLESCRGPAPTAAPTESITFEFSKNNRMVGCKPRHVILNLKKAAASGNDCILPPGQTTKRVVVLRPDTNPPTGTEVTVNGRVWVVGSVVGEQMR
jgi:hypothetical protein